MALSNLFSLLSEKMDYLTQRQGVIAQNIAQANTPGYKPKDLVSFDEVLKQTSAGQSGSSSSLSSGFHLAVTDPRHISGAGGSLGSTPGSFKTQKIKDVYEIKPNGNAVVLEQQMSALSETTTQYQMMTGLYKKTLSLIKTALGRAGT